MYLLIDDCRTFGDAIARHSRAAKLLLPLRCWTCVAFDHDLGYQSEDGYQILVWALENGHLPNMVELVTSNPVGRARMTAALLNDGGYMQESAITFVRKT
jgi:hypothetical protein